MKREVHPTHCGGGRESNIRKSFQLDTVLEKMRRGSSVKEKGRYGRRKETHAKAENYGCE